MDKKVDKYINRKNCRYWHYYHLLLNREFKKSVKELDDTLVINFEDGSSYHPSELENFATMYTRYTRLKKYNIINPHGPEMDKLINEFTGRWCISNSRDLLDHLIKGKIPPVRNDHITLVYDEPFKSFRAHIPTNVERTDMDLLWEKIKNERSRLGINAHISKDVLTETTTEMAYCMWKMRTEGKTWTEVVKIIDKKFNTSYTNDIKTAQNLLKTHGIYV